MLYPRIILKAHVGANNPLIYIMYTNPPFLSAGHFIGPSQFGYD